MRLHCNLLRVAAAGLFFTGPGWAQGPGLQNSNLYYVQTIPVPNWKVGVSNVDLFGFNPATRTLYLADRTNHAIDVIDARVSAVVGFIPLAANSVPNQPLVISDLQQLAVSDGVQSVFVYDLRAPGNAPDQYTNTSGCPATPPSAFGTLVPIVGVFDAVGSGTATIDGVACSGRGNHIAGVDPIDNLIYVPVSQYPADPNSTTTGQAGIVVFRDVTPSAQAAFTSASATLTPVGSGSASGTVHMLLQDRRIYVDALPTGIQGQAAWLTVPTTVGNELTPCAVNTTAASAVCGEQLIGDPLLGATITLSVDFAAVARGIISKGP